MGFKTLNVLLVHTPVIPRYMPPENRRITLKVRQEFAAESLDQACNPGYLGRLSQKDHKFTACLDYRVSSRLALATS